MYFVHLFVYVCLFVSLSTFTFILLFTNNGKMETGIRTSIFIARPSVCRLSVTLVRPTQAVQVFGNISTALGTLAIR